MMFWQLYFNSLAAILVFGFIGWLISLYRNNVTHIDSMWSLFFLVVAFTFFFNIYNIDLRSIVILSLLSIWALRLSVFLTYRNWGLSEDHRYKDIRKNNQPNFKLKSLYIIFGLQGILAWIISLPILGALISNNEFNILDGLGALLVLFGIIWETTADWQLSRFKNNPANIGKVLNSGLWHYSRHPNYFGESCVWWGFYLISIAAGSWWTFPSPIIMTVLLIKISGVSLLEKDIAKRRPEYENYVSTTNAFIPGPPKGLPK